jgi:hypothetical protein
MTEETKAHEPSAPIEGTGGPITPSACTAEIAECTCPEFCERDHELD